MRSSTTRGIGAKAHAPAHAVSDVSEIDGRELPLGDALRAAVGRQRDAIARGIGTKRAFYENHESAQIGCWRHRFRRERAPDLFERVHRYREGGELHERVEAQPDERAGHADVTHSLDVEEGVERGASARKGDSDSQRV